MLSLAALEREELCWWYLCSLPGAEVDCGVEPTDEPGTNRAARVVLCGIHAQLAADLLEAGWNVEVWHQPDGTPVMLATREVEEAG